MRKILVAFVVSVSLFALVYLIILAMERWAEFAVNVFGFGGAGLVATLSPMLIIFFGLIYYIVKDEI